MRVKRYADIGLAVNPSSTDRAHLAAYMRGLSHGQVVVRGFVPCGLKKDFSQVIVAASPAQGSFEILLAIRQQTRPKLSAGGQPQAIAPAAELMADGRDKPNLAFGPLEPVAVRRAVHFTTLHRQQRSQNANTLFDIRD
jgi:hypothetical protein